MKNVTMKVDFITHTDEVIGRIVYDHWIGSGKWDRRKSKELVYGRVLDSGSYQLYTIRTGSIEKIRGVVKAHNIDFSEALNK